MKSVVSASAESASSSPGSHAPAPPRPRAPLFRPTPSAADRAARRRTKLRKTIFALCRERGISDDLRHELQLSVTGKPSLQGCSAAEMLTIIARVSGQKVWTAKGILDKLAADLPDGPKRLRAFCWMRFQREPKDLDQNQTRSAIACLRNWLKEKAKCP